METGVSSASSVGQPQARSQGATSAQGNGVAAAGAGCPCLLHNTFGLRVLPFLEQNPAPSPGRSLSRGGITVRWQWHGGAGVNGGTQGESFPLIRPEWLFEIVARLQRLAAVPLSGDSQVDLGGPALPRSSLEEGLARHLVARLAAERLRWERLCCGTQAQALPKEQECLLSPSLIRVVLAQQILDSEFSDPWTVHALAKRVGCNRTDLTLGFRRCFNVTVHQYLVARRVDAACALLRSSGWRVEAIAKSTGFRSKVSLYQQFNRLLGMTPHEYRQRWTMVPVTRSVKTNLSRLFKG